MSKQFFWLFLALFLWVGVGCTTAVSEPIEETVPPPTAVSVAVEEVAVEEEEEGGVDEPTAVYGDLDTLNLNGVTIRFWHQHREQREEELNAIIDEFNATNPYGITVQASNEGSYGDIYDKMISGLTTGDLPDIVVAYQNQAAAYQTANGLISLEPYINHPTFGFSEAELADFFPSFIAQDRLPQFDGQAFGFPPHRSMEVLYYNQDWLTELGYDAPPSTPEQFYEMACAATDPSAGTVGYQISTDASRFASLVFAQGGDIYDYEANQFTLNSEEAIAAMTLMQQMFADGCAILIAERHGDQLDFGKRLTLFTIGSSSGLPIYQEMIEQSEAEPFAWSVAPIPHTTSEPVQNIYGASVSVPRTTPERQLAAWLFLKHYTTPAVQSRWARASNYFPVRASVAADLDDYFVANPAYATSFGLLPYGKAEPPVAGYDNVRDSMAEAYSRILNGEDVRTVLDELNQQANQTLAAFRP